MAIANHETVKGVDRIVEEESMKELFKDETYIQENVDVVLLERPKTIKISTQKTAKKAGMMKEDKKAAKNHGRIWNQKTATHMTLHELKDLYLYIIIYVNRK